MDRFTRQRSQKTSPGTTFRVLDVFCGAGGISQGFRQAGFQIVAGVDSDPDALATFALNFPEARVIHGDLRDEGVSRQVLEVASGIDVLVGGPPCQAFSQVRNHSRLIDDPRNRLYRQFIAILKQSRPIAFLMENVTGIDQLRVREQILDDLAVEGEYDVRAQVVDAADFGVPQSRRRLLFLGVRRGLGISAPTLKGTGATSSIALRRETSRHGSRYAVFAQEGLLGIGSLLDALRDPRDTSVVSVRDAIEDLNFLEPGRRCDEIEMREIPEPTSAYQRSMRAGAGAILQNVQVPRSQADTVIRLGEIPVGGNHRDLAPEFLDRYLTGQKWGQSNGSGKLSRRHFYAYRRLHPEMWAWTLNTKADAVYHYSTARALSVREFARLQSFPDRFVITVDARGGPIAGRVDGGAAHSRYRQVGNAVPVLLAMAAASDLQKLLATVVPDAERKSA